MNTEYSGEIFQVLSCISLFACMEMREETKNTVYLFGQSGTQLKTEGMHQHREKLCEDLNGSLFFFITRYRMNTKTVILVVLVTALAIAICSASRGSDVEDMPYRQLLHELRKKGTDMRKRFGEV